MLTYLSFVLFLLGAILASWATPLITQGLITLQALLTIGGFIILMGLKPYRTAVLSPDTQAFPELTPYRRLPFWQYGLGLFIVQGTFFILSVIFFVMLESMTQTNPRLQALEIGRFLQVSHQHGIMIHYLPWVLYAVMGVGLAYFIVRRGAPAVLADVIIPDCQRHPRLFVHNYLAVVTETVRFGPFMNLVTLSVLWQCQALNSIFQLEPLSTTPFRTVFVCLLIFLFFQKSRQKLLDFLREQKAPLGGIMVFFALIIAFFVFWLHSTGSWFSLGIENTNSQQVMKSILAGFTKEAEENRLCLLMWGWWGIWIPWMSSLIARLSMGRSLWVACLSALVFPTICFALFSNVTIEQWTVFDHFLREPIGAAAVAVFLLLFMLAFFGHVQSTKDVARGGLILTGKWRGPLFSKWVNVVLTTVACYLPGLFMLGWLSAQVINTIGTIFISTVVLGFILALLSSRAPLAAEVRYRVPEPL